MNTHCENHRTFFSHDFQFLMQIRQKKAIFVMAYASSTPTDFIIIGAAPSTAIKKPVRLSFQPLIFSQPAVFFSHTKSANSTFSRLFSAQANRLVQQYCLT
jgi:hypothetical protein